MESETDSESHSSSVFYNYTDDDVPDWAHLDYAPLMNGFMMDKYSFRNFVSEKSKYMFREYRGLLNSKVYHPPVERRRHSETIVFGNDMQEHDDEEYLSEVFNIIKNPLIYAERNIITQVYEKEYDGIDFILQPPERGKAPMPILMSASRAYNPYPVKSGYKRCFDFIWKHAWTEPMLILHQVPNPNWVAEYHGAKIMNPYLYRVAYVSNKIYDRESKTMLLNEKRDSVFCIRLEPENEYRSHPTHMTSIPSERWYYDPTATTKMRMGRQATFFRGQVHNVWNPEFGQDGTLYQYLYQLFYKRETESLHIEDYWFGDVDFTTEAWLQIPPFTHYGDPLSTYHYSERGQPPIEIRDMGDFPILPVPEGFHERTFDRYWHQEQNWQAIMKQREPNEDEWEDLQKSTILSYFIAKYHLNPRNFGTCLVKLRDQGAEI